MFLPGTLKHYSCLCSPSHEVLRCLHMRPISCGSRQGSPIASPTFKVKKCRTGIRVMSADIRQPSPPGLLFVRMGNRDRDRRSAFGRYGMFLYSREKRCHRAPPAGRLLPHCFLLVALLPTYQATHSRLTAGVLDALSLGLLCMLVQLT